MDHMWEGTALWDVAIELVEGAVDFPLSDSQYRRHKKNKEGMGSY